MKHLPDWMLERYLLQEIPDELAQEVTTASQDPAVAARLLEIQESNATILAALPPGAVASSVRARARVDTHRPQRVWAVALATMAASLLLVVQPDEPEETDRSKGSAHILAASSAEYGEPRLLAYRQAREGGAARPLAQTDLLHPGDVLQLSYVAAGALYGVIVSVDGRGAVTLHYPATPDDTTALTNPDERPLPSAYELDDTPSYECFTLVTAQAPFDPRLVMNAARRRHTPGKIPNQALRLPGAFQQHQRCWFKAR